MSAAPVSLHQAALPRDLRRCLVFSAIVDDAPPGVFEELRYRDPGFMQRLGESVVSDLWVAVERAAPESFGGHSPSRSPLRARDDALQSHRSCIGHHAPPTSAQVASRLVSPNGIWFAMAPRVGPIARAVLPPVSSDPGAGHAVMPRGPGSTVPQTAAFEDPSVTVLCVVLEANPGVPIPTVAQGIMASVRGDAELALAPSSDMLARHPLFNAATMPGVAVSMRPIACRFGSDLSADEVQALGAVRFSRGAPKMALERLNASMAVESSGFMNNAAATVHHATHSPPPPPRQSRVLGGQHTTTADRHMVVDVNGSTVQTYRPPEALSARRNNGPVRSLFHSEHTMQQQPQQQASAGLSREDLAVLYDYAPAASQQQQQQKHHVRQPQLPQQYAVSQQRVPPSPPRTANRLPMGRTENRGPRYLDEEGPTAMVQQSLHQHQQQQHSQLQPHLQQQQPDQQWEQFHSTQQHQQELQQRRQPSTEQSGERRVVHVHNADLAAFARDFRMGQPPQPDDGRLGGSQFLGSEAPLTPHSDVVFYNPSASGKGAPRGYAVRR